MIEKIYSNEIILAIIIKSNYQNEGIAFFTSDSDSQQLGYMTRKKGYEIIPHRHNLIQREVHLTQEVLFIKKGKLRVDFYDNKQNYLESKILITGDVILLSDGGHGFKMLKPTEIIEVKQGPYSVNNDKIFIEPVNEKKVKIIN